METVKWEWRTLHDDIRMLCTLCHVCQFRTSKVCYLLWSNVQFKNRHTDIKIDYGWRKHAVRYKPNATDSKFWVGDSHSGDAEDSTLLILNLIFESDEPSSFTVWFTCEMFVPVFGLFICFKLLPRTCKKVNILGTVGILRDNIRMDLQEVGCGYVDWIGLAKDRERWRTLVNAVMNLRVP